ncbi:MAG: alpha-L-fucosidase [Akkermansiaceae bacterium]|nr:alpha-L-fucosidase [Akkermansiaceae bacterium]
MKLKSLYYALAACAAFASAADKTPPPPAPYGAVPTKQQVDWLRMEWYAFVHFGINTYTNKEWGYGDENPKLFNPTDFDAEAIVSTFKKAGMSGMIYTAKHHDGFCLWPTKTTKHNITQSPWKNGKGDVVREFANACAKYNFKFGTYLSPWDRNHAEYGRPGYLDAYYAQITELLTNYGPIFEIWFDGANGGDGYYGGAKEKRSIGKSEQYYNFPKVVRMIRKLQPNCIIWGAALNGDVTWGGSEQGFIADRFLPVRNIISRSDKGAPEVGPWYHRDSGKLLSDDAAAKFKNKELLEKWVSLEADTTINASGWFWHPNSAKRVKSPQVLMDRYMRSVGVGANLILNVAPGRNGRLDEADVHSLLVFGEMRRRLLAKDFARSAKVKASEVRANSPAYAGDRVTDGDIESYWCPNDGTRTGELELTLKAPATFDVVRLREQIRLGRRVNAFQVDIWDGDKWTTVISDGATIGNQIMKKLPQPVTTKKVRVRITDARACPCISEVSLLRMPDANEVQISDVKPDSAEGDDLPLLSRKGWTSLSAKGAAALDDKPETFWSAKRPDDKGHASLVVDMGKEVMVKGFTYLPRQDGKLDNMTDRYRFEVSSDGKKWKKMYEGEFSNIEANPIELYIYEEGKLEKARFFRLIGLHALRGTGASAAEVKIIGHPAGK